MLNSSKPRSFLFLAHEVAEQVKILNCPAVSLHNSTESSTDDGDDDVVVSESAAPEERILFLAEDVRCWRNPTHIPDKSESETKTSRILIDHGLIIE